MSPELYVQCMEIAGVVIAMATGAMATAYFRETRRLRRMLEIERLQRAMR